MIYFNLWFKNKDTYDYLITKCDNSISQAFLAYFVLQSAVKLILLQSVREFYY